MLLPTEVRRALATTGPSRLILTIDHDAVRLRTPAQMLEHIRGLARPPYKRNGRPASGTFILAALLIAVLGVLGVLIGKL